MRLPAFAAGLGLALALAVVADASAQGLALSGSMGARVLLIVDGQPLVLSPGQSARGVRLLEWRDGRARVEREGRIVELRVGEAPVSLGALPPSAATEVVLVRDAGGHFIGSGAINGRPMRFMVDTGATTVALSQAQAQRMGIDWRRGLPVVTQTAGGPVPVHRVSLALLRVGEVEIRDVDAVVLPQELPYVLLGNSALARFQMRRDQEVMRLELSR